MLAFLSAFLRAPRLSRIPLTKCHMHACTHNAFASNLNSNFLAIHCKRFLMEKVLFATAATSFGTNIHNASQSFSVECLLSLTASGGG